MTVRTKLAAGKQKAAQSKKQAVQGTALTVATGLMLFALEAGRAGDYYVTTVGVVVAGGIFIAYAFFNESSQRSKIDELIDTIGEDTFEEIVNTSADELREAFENAQDSNSDE